MAVADSIDLKQFIPSNSSKQGLLNRGLLFIFTKQEYDIDFDNTITPDE